MAALDALHTPPSASLAAMLSHPCAQTQHSPCSYIETPEAMDDLPHDTADDVHSSDKENSPSLTTTKSTRLNRCSPGTENFLQMSPVKRHVSFTPQRVRPPPRAWERRPATPFVTRNEGQKIWKRIPLQELSVDVNQWMLRQQRQEKEDYQRVTKRLRLDVDNKIAGMNSLGEDTKVAVGTKWEEDCIERDGSPRKKVCPGLVEQDKTAERVFNTDTASVREQEKSRIEDNAPVSIDENCLEPSVQPTSESCLVVAIEPELETTENHLRRSHEITCITSSANEEKSAEDDAMAQPDKAVPKDSQSVLVESDDNNETQTEMATVQSGESLNPTESSPDQTGNTVVKCSEQSVDAHANQESTSLSSPQNDMSAAYTSSSCASIVTADDSLTNTNNQVAHVPVITEQDETAFLRDFLQRAQASKAARIILSPQKKPVSLPSVKEESQVKAVRLQLVAGHINDEIEDDDLSPPIESAEIKQMFSASDAKPVPSTRRSARNAVRTAGSRLPRFQASHVPLCSSVLPSQSEGTPLPGTIQLKRATGTEFIFNAKHQQTLAMMTRSNTRKNQGDAIHVVQRLVQLKQDSNVGEEKEVATQISDSTVCSTTSESPVVGEEHSGSTNKKRKRERQDTGKTTNPKRTVRWPSDELLAVYHEADHVANSEVAVGASEECSVTTDNDTDDVYLAESKDPTARAEPRSSKDEIAGDSAKLKVRRIRKIKLDSVNGTPAPKTRTRSMPVPQSVDADGGPTTVIHPSTVLGTRKSLRIPVPASSSTPLALTSSGSSKIRDNNVDKQRSEAVPSTKITSSVGKTAAAGDAKPEKANSSHDLDRKLEVRRRLRTRV